ncbi:hypothetical protein SASPL_133800 [Salvia splendens]|uniref:Uncharacterized protein n=1 Tax=Salvia splendens TaxID=180675 RepID=A0A8X8X6D0_SALSN|nr:hypothetical protein SASPL_133800 [Salvia splendens]
MSFEALSCQPATVPPRVRDAVVSRSIRKRTGRTALDLAASKKRCASVVSQIRSRHGIAPSTLRPRGALDKFFSVSSNVNVNEDQWQESGHEQEHDHNLAAEVEVNEDATAPGEQSLIAEVEINEENSNEENLHTENPNGTASGEPSLHTENSDGLLSIFDPSTWENLDNVKRDFSVHYSERSFSKLKLLKNYLRSTMLQDRLNGLATCSIEKGILENVDLNIVLANFASRNARRSFLL